MQFIVIGIAKFRFELKRLLRRVIKFADVDRKFPFLNEAFLAVSRWGIDGDYCEFGVYRGRSLVLAFQESEKLIAKGYSQKRRYWGFDSFEGLPSPMKQEEGIFNLGQFAFSLSNVQENLKKNRVDLDKVKLVKGYYEDILNDDFKQSLRNENFKVAILYLDCDLYESTLIVLNFIEEFLQNGSLIYFDDWFSYACHPEKGQPRALREFLVQHPTVKLESWGPISTISKSFIFNRLT